MNDSKTSSDKIPHLQQRFINLSIIKIKNHLCQNGCHLYNYHGGIKSKKNLDQNTLDKDFLDYTDENNLNYIHKSLIKSSLNTSKVIDYYNQIKCQLIQLFYDTIKLQKDCIITFHSKWDEQMRTNAENYLIFHDKIIMLYSNMYNIYYLKNIFTKIKEPEKMKDKEIYIMEH